MKIKLSCRECKDDKYQFIDLRDDIYYKFKCKNGHLNNVILQAEKFEILFEMGLMALIDGYTREAVSSFVASLERFYEYIIELVITHNGIDYEQFSYTWKMMSSQSERQLGSFYISYLINFGDAPPKLDNKIIEFRNRVIHKGYIPSTNEVKEYGNSIFNYIVKVLIRFDLNIYMPSILKMTKKKRESLEIDYNYGVIGLATVPIGLQHHFIHLLEKLNFDKLLMEKEKQGVMKGFFK